MTVDELTEYRRATPFRPFRLFLTDGRAYTVRETFHVARNARSTMVAVPCEDDTGEMVNGSLLDRVELCVAAPLPFPKNPLV